MRWRGDYRASGPKVVARYLLTQLALLLLIPYLRSPNVACCYVKQEVFLLRKNPGRPLASLFLPWRGALVLTLFFAYVN